MPLVITLVINRLVDNVDESSYVNVNGTENQLLFAFAFTVTVGVFLAAHI